MSDIDHELKQQVIDEYGEAFFYTSLREFFETHRNATSIHIDSKTGIPLSAEYRFPPVHCHREREQTLAAVAQALQSETDEHDGGA